MAPVLRILLPSDPPFFSLRPAVTWRVTTLSMTKRNLGPFFPRSLSLSPAFLLPRRPVSKTSSGVTILLNQDPLAHIPHSSPHPDLARFHSQIFSPSFSLSLFLLLLRTLSSASFLHQTHSREHETLCHKYLKSIFQPPLTEGLPRGLVTRKNLVNG